MQTLSDNRTLMTPADDATESIQAVIRQHVTQVMVRYRGNRLRAARALGVTRSTLYKWLKQWDLEQLGR
jgi:DNA-binding protein Fis